MEPVALRDNRLYFPQYIRLYPLRSNAKQGVNRMPLRRFSSRASAKPVALRDNRLYFWRDSAEAPIKNTPTKKPNGSALGWPPITVPLPQSDFRNSTPRPLTSGVVWVPVTRTRIRENRSVQSACRAWAQPVALHIYARHWLEPRPVRAMDAPIFSRVLVTPRIHSPRSISRKFQLRLIRVHPGPVNLKLPL